jgi:hypothetical protein
MLARKRTLLLGSIQALAQIAVQGTLVEVMLRCGKRSCGCHVDPARRHGPALYLKFRNPAGRSTSIYVPRRHEAQARRAVEAWERMAQLLRELTRDNRDALSALVKIKE